MTRDKLSNLETMSLGSALEDGNLAVFYEDLAGYSLRYMHGSKDDLLLRVEEEVNLHVTNLTYLSLYFDVVLIQTSVVFNLTDPFVSRVVQGTISHPRFQEMLRTGVVKIVGWGGKTPAEMFASAYEFSSPLTDKLFSDINYLGNVQRLFTPESVVYRTEDKPDEDNDQKFRDLILGSSVLRSEEDLESVEAAILNSESLLGQLTSIGFKPSIEASNLSETQSKGIYELFYRSWVDHIDATIPNVYAYVPSLAPFALTHLIRVGDRKVHSFLYSPAIFATYFNAQFEPRELNRVMGKPFTSLFGLRNGEWSRFKYAYHRAVVEVSDSIAALDLTGNAPFDPHSTDVWQKKISEVMDNPTSEIDVAAYLTSLSSISGALAGMPVAGSIVRAVMSVFGKTIERTFHESVRRHGGEASGYINKVRSNLVAQGAFN